MKRNPRRPKRLGRGLVDAISVEPFWGPTAESLGVASGAYRGPGGAWLFPPWGLLDPRAPEGAKAGARGVELRQSFPDCYTRHEENAGLIDALFPKRVSAVWPLD